VYTTVKTNDLIVVNIEAQRSTCSIYRLQAIYVKNSTSIICQNDVVLDIYILLYVGIIHTEYIHVSHEFTMVKKIV